MSVRRPYDAAAPGSRGGCGVAVAHAAFLREIEAGDYGAAVCRGVANNARREGDLPPFVERPSVKGEPLAWLASLRAK